MPARQTSAAATSNTPLLKIVSAYIQQKAQGIPLELLDRDQAKELIHVSIWL